jgi:hypothetical protein
MDLRMQKKGLGLILLVGLLFSCSKKVESNSAADDIEETAQQVGDVVASIDEVGGVNGAIVLNERAIDRTFARLGYGPSLFELMIPNAYAATCGASTFLSCSSNRVTRSFLGCTLGGGTYTGTVTLNWGGSSSNCVLQAPTDTITRVPNFTVTGRRNATLEVSKTGTIGQRLTWDSGTGTNKVFQFTNDGIRRVFTGPSGTVLFDLTTTTSSPITVTGTSRSSRFMDGGTLKVTNNVSGVTCDFSPSSVSWSSGCNCPTMGSWSATCSDGKTSTLTHTGCGTANFTLGAISASVTLDRCI